MKWSFALACMFVFFFSSISFAASIVDRVTGYILLQVEEKGEAWYVYSEDQERYYLGRPDDAFSIMRELGLGITNSDLEQIPVSDNSGDPETEEDTQDGEGTSTDEGSISLFSTLLSFNPNDGFNGQVARTLEDGWLSFVNDEDLFEEYLESLDTYFDENVSLAEDTNYQIDREIPGAFVWNVIEPEQGTYQWDLTDKVIGYVNQAGMRISAVISPFAAWDQDEIPDGCEAIDFAYYDYKAGTPNDWDAYEDFLRALVERYDGDGEDDMPGLEYPIKEWEIGNEYDGACGGNLNEAENFYELMERSYETIKGVDPDARVLNGGALEINSNIIDTRAYWEEFFELGGGEYIDAFNFHYNVEKGGASSDADFFIETLDFFNGLMQQYDEQKPLWITEFGTFSGTATMGLGSAKTQSEEFQAAWYFRYAILAFANHVETIFIDMKGQDNTNIGGSALYDQDGEERVFAQTLDSLAGALEGFSDVEELDDGQYFFDVNGNDVYALWDGDLPNEIDGTVSVINYLGEEVSMEAEDIEFSEDEPVLVIVE